MEVIIETKIKDLERCDLAKAHNDLEEKPRPKFKYPVSSPQLYPPGQAASLVFSSFWNLRIREKPVAWSQTESQ